MTALTGELGGRYRLGGVRATGGQGVVYDAVDELDSRPVVVKVALVPGDPAVRDGALRLAALGEDPVAGPRFVPVWDVGTWEDRAFVVLERMDETLAQAVERGVDRRRAVGAVLAAAAALEQAGVVHGDLKPSNVFLRDDGPAGVAALLADPWGGGDDAVLSPGFAAPELWRGARPSPAADRYALGCTMYAVMAGHPPACAAASPPRAPTAEELDRVPAGWRRRLAGLLAPEPDRRPLVAEVVRGSVLERRPPPRWVWGAGLAAVAAVTAVAVSRSEPPRRTPACPPPFARAGAGCRAPDGRRVAWVPAGRWRAGAVGEDVRWAADALPVDVTLRDGLWARTTEVTQGEARALLGENPVAVRTEWFPALNRALPCASWEGHALVDDALPVACITWYDAIGLANAASRADGLREAYRVEAGLDGPSVTWDRTADGWRLPTEAEWEWLARGADAGQRWAGAPSRDTICTHANPRDRSAPEAWGNEVPCADGVPVLAPVGSFAPNALGLHDVLGNVAEWVWDRYGDRDGPTLVDPTGPVTGPYRVYRGGGWNEIARPTSARYAVDPGVGGLNVGVRLVRPGR